MNLLIICFLLSFGDANQTVKIPVVDLTKNYPEKEFVVDEADKKYVILETTDDVLADRSFSIKYTSDQRIIAINSRQGDIFIFNGAGKVVSFFNNKGGSSREYLSLQSIVYDEQNKEIFVLDSQDKNQCLVYSEDGKFVRKLNFPEESLISELLDFDEQTLLAYTPSYERRNVDVFEKMPYMFISKKDGRILSHLDLSFPERISNTLRSQGGRSALNIYSMLHPNMVKVGKEWIIANNSSDTVYLLTLDKKLTPLVVRTPTFIKDNKIVTMGVYLKTEKYLFFTTQTDYLSEMFEKFTPGRGPVELSPSKDLALDLQTGELFIIKGITRFPCLIDVSGKATVNSFGAYNLKNLLKDGKVEGKLKEIAQKIDEEDNPVVEIAKYK